MPPIPPPNSLALFGLLWCGIAAACVWWRYRRHGVRTVATIVRFVEHDHPHDSGRVRRPVVEFRTATGETVAATCTGYHDFYSRPCPNVGDRLRVAYIPARPTDVIVLSRYRGYYVFLAGFAAFWVVACTLMEMFPSP